MPSSSPAYGLLSTRRETLDIGGSSTYAFVIGISDYRGKDIPDLRFSVATATWSASPNLLAQPGLPARGVGSFVL
ncbi:MAG: hypothetical protein ACOYNO_02895 [Saprospiraceae bacterium]